MQIILQGKNLSNDFGSLDPSEQRLRWHAESYKHSPKDRPVFFLLPENEDGRKWGTILV